MRKSFLLLLIALVLLGTAFGQSDKVWDGAFGLKFGMTFAEVEAVLGRDVLDADRKEDDELRAYRWSVGDNGGKKGWQVARVYIHPSDGLFQFMCVNVVKTDGWGTELKITYKDALNALNETYGKGDEIDRLAPGSLWDEPRDYMMGLLEGERILGAKWVFADGEQHPLNEIFMQVEAISRKLGGVAIFYSSKASTKFEMEEREKDKARF